MAKYYSSRSRLQRNVEKQSKKRLIFSLVGIIIILFLVFKVGIPLLVRFSLLVGDLKDDASPVDKKRSILLPPRLSSLPTATNSASLRIEGVGVKDARVVIYLNSDLTRKIKTDENGNFSLDGLKLSAGSNSIKARLEIDEDQSDFSDEVTITYDNDPPKIELVDPYENQVFPKDQRNITVSGITEGATHVTINGFWAVIDGNGNFSYNLPLNSGDNKIVIEAQDEAGNKAAIERKVTLSQ